MCARQRWWSARGSGILARVRKPREPSPGARQWGYFSERKGVIASVVISFFAAVVTALIVVPPDQPWARLATVLSGFPVSALVIWWFFWNRRRVQLLDQAPDDLDE